MKQLWIPPINPAPGSHTRLQYCSRPALGLRVGSFKPTIAVISRPIIFVVPIGVVYRVLCLVSGRIDERERLRDHDVLLGHPKYSTCRLKVCYSLEGLRAGPHGRWRNLLSAAIIEVTSMQMFIAELSTAIERVEFERSWRSVPAVDGDQRRVEFNFVGRKISAIIDSESAERWPSASFYRAFSAAVHRVDRDCNIRWL